ncbi:hypothetical protein BDB01DRAFT_537175 [Pilobolus umbonatus]|nr:hypothetical protein BDB01DRAFT_537175 [Pilobolus umbonatus]
MDLSRLAREILCHFQRKESLVATKSSKQEVHPIIFKDILAEMDKFPEMKEHNLIMDSAPITHK